jgi:DNA-directed RNA polymerase subunit RPC12/RpoP
MAKFPEAIARMYSNVYCCKKCKAKIRTSNKQIRLGKVKCRNCNGKAFRPIKRSK